MQPVLGLAAVSKGDRGSDTCPGELRWPQTSSVGFCPPPAITVAFWPLQRHEQDLCQGQKNPAGT